MSGSFAKFWPNYNAYADSQKSAMHLLDPVKKNNVTQSLKE